MIIDESYLPGSILPFPTFSTDPSLHIQCYAVFYARLKKAEHIMG